MHHNNGAIQIIALQLKSDTAQVSRLFSRMLLLHCPTFSPGVTSVTNYVITVNI